MIRAPTIEELASLSELCLRSKAAWGYNVEFLEACRSELFFDQRDLQLTSIAIAEHGGEVVGVAQVTDMPSAPTDFCAKGALVTRTVGHTRVLSAQRIQDVCSRRIGSRSGDAARALHLRLRWTRRQRNANSRLGFPRGP